MDKQSRIWSLRKAKARFSEVVRRAQTDGPQIVTVHGKNAVTISDARAGTAGTKKLTAADLVGCVSVLPSGGFRDPTARTNSRVSRCLFVTRWLVDTNVISEVRRKPPAVEFVRWIELIDLEDLFTSTKNIAELRFGVMMQDSASDAHLLTLWIEDTVRPWFSGRILEVDERALLRWRMLVREAERMQGPAPAADLLIGAIAIEHGFIVSTRDSRPFVAAGVPVLNPWTGERFNY